MGIDLPNTRLRSGSGRRKTPKSKDPYLLLLVRLYKFLSRRTASKVNKTILKRLLMSKQFKPVVSISALNKLGQKRNKDSIIAVVATVTNDERLLVAPKLTVAALKFTRTARQRIENAGGRALTFDQLAIERPTGSNTILVQGKRGNREARRYFRGVHGGHAAIRKRKSSHVGRGQEATHTRKHIK